MPAIINREPLDAKLNRITFSLRKQVTLAQSKKVKRYDSLKVSQTFKQCEFSFDLGEEMRIARELNPPLSPEKRKFVTWRNCLKCDRGFRSKINRLCERCKRHEDYLEGEDGFGKV